MTALERSVGAKKARLDDLRPLAGEALRRLEHFYDIEITWSSNAIEGNTLSAVETTVVIEQGITIGGKPLRDHLEAVDHFNAMGFMRGLSRDSEAPIRETDIRNLHRAIVERSQPEIAGQYAAVARYVRTETGRHDFPEPHEIRPLMTEMSRWLGDAPDTPGTAFEAHLRLVSIHPFSDGNGRTARLLMNLILIRGGYPPVAVRPEERLPYTRALQTSQAGLGDGDFMELMYQRLDSTLDEYLKTIETT
jgi:Fic family protein